MPVSDPSMAPLRFASRNTVPLTWPTNCFLRPNVCGPPVPPFVMVPESGTVVVGVSESGGTGATT